MVYTKARYAIEIVIQLLAASAAGLLSYQGFFYAQENGQLLAAIVAILMLLFVQALYSLRNTFITRVRIHRRYGVALSMNEVGFLRRTDSNGFARIQTKQFPEGLLITSVDHADWALRNWEGRQELARA